MALELSRRSFLIGAGALGTGLVAGMAGCAPQAPNANASTSNEGASSIGQPSFLNEPEPITDIKDTIEADVVVVGLGVAGVSATRSAAESGLNVIAIERCGEPSARSSQFAAFNTESARMMGIEDVDTAELVNEMMAQTGHRPDFRVLKNWADHCGEAFDWYAGAYDGLLWQTPEGEKYDADKDAFVVNRNLYKPYEFGVDHERVFTGTLSFSTPDKGGHKPIMLANLEKAQATGRVDARFNCRARQLVKDGERVAGVVFEDVTTGEFTQVNAKKGVVLATGGYVRNDELLAYYLPWIYNLKDKFSFTYAHMDANGEFTDQGDGMLMGHWAGGHIEEGPHCAMAHGDLGKLGVDAFLQLNALGERYINEDLTNDHFGSAILRQPDSTIYQLFDANFPEQAKHMQSSLGAYTAIAPETVDTVDEWTSAKGDTIDELIANLDVSADVAKTMKEQIERYNELCEKGKDEDFGKAAERMFALNTPPYYAIRYEVSGGPSDDTHNALRCLVTMSGLSTNQHAQVLDANLHVLPGLYAIGNTQGGRFLGDYPATLAGASHSLAMTYGYLTGKHLAEQA
ncbi:FAD-dependent oxidoreductase [Eggerthella sinensis]|uniref:FAD-dependent oxidoreductase n=1 Tax=Eggerthella sinensis TaxID=242230 RepID=UPI00248EC0E0|nr:FAD-dependent oxidoreductase [Eggerthella sinensis]